MILDKVGVIQSHPFPHVVVENAIDPDLYRELVRTWPTKQPRNQNNRIMLSRGRKLLENPDLPDVWRSFIKAHQSREFFQKVNSLFNLGLSGEVSPRGDHKTIGMECQLADTSPVNKACSVKLPHRDNPKTKWAAILYFRDPKDNAGGHLQFHDCQKPDFTGNWFAKNPGDVFLTIPYEANTLVCWVNTDKAVHGVSPRQPTEIPRRYVNFTVDVRSGN